MLIADLIQKLTELQATVGNVPVVIEQHNYDSAADFITVKDVQKVSGLSRLVVVNEEQWIETGSTTRSDVQCAVFIM